MGKIASKTKIILWGVAGEKEKIDFDLCDFSSEQVADLDRLVRADGESKVRLTIEPEQKKLQIAAIAAVVGLVSLSCREKGQKLKVRGFKSPDERATAIKRMCAADTPVLLTIDEISPGLFGKSTKDSPAQPAAAQPSVEETHTAFECKFKGLRGCKCHLEILGRRDGWRAKYSAKLGNISGADGTEQVNPAPTRAMAINGALKAILCWLDEIEITGTADARRSLAARRDQMKEQVTEQLQNLIGPQTEEFAEDDSAEGELNADEDQDI